MGNSQGGSLLTASGLEAVLLLLLSLLLVVLLILAKLKGMP
jgi:hypothetical protein